MADAKTEAEHRNSADSRPYPHKRRRLAMIIVLIVVVFVLLMVWGLSNDIQIGVYSISSPKVTEAVRLVCISDLHSCDYGPGQRQLTELIDSQSPHAVLLSGDIVDKRLPEQKAWELVEALIPLYPCYYVIGNHECWDGEADRIKERMADYGVTVLAGAGAQLSAGGQTLAIWGVDDPAGGAEQFAHQLAACADELRQEQFNLLLCHRPERADEYAVAGYDLAVTGHAHGGQWRIPFTKQGLIAPDQGLFPKYSGGKYELGAGWMIVSRGLAKESTSIPRLFNPPELVVIDIVPGGGP